MIAASTLGDDTEVRTLLKTGQFVVNATDSIGNINESKSKKLQAQKPLKVSLRFFQII